MRRYLLFMTIVSMVMVYTTTSIFAQEPGKPKIEVEGADTVWETGLSISPELISIAKKVTPRIVTEFVDLIFFSEFNGSEDLNKVSKTVSPRIIVEYADLLLTNNLQGSGELVSVAKTVHPRIIVEYADSLLTNNLQGSGELVSVAKTVRPRIIVEYADSILTKDLSKFSTAVQKRIMKITSSEGNPGSSIDVQVNIDNATGVISGDITIKYDANVLTIGEVKGADIISGMSLMVNKNTPGILKISLAGTKGLLSGSGTVINISLTINTDAKPGTQTSLELSNVSIYDDLGKVIPLSLENGVVKVSQPKGIKGDVNGDGEVRANDAMLALRIAAGLLVPDEHQKWAADMNDDGAVKSNDAMLILRKAAGLGAPSKNIIASASKPINIMLTEIHGVAGESITVPVNVDNIDKLASGDICITYDSSVLRAVSISSDHNLLLESNINNPGIVRISFANKDRLNSKTIAKIKFAVIADKISPLSIQMAELYNADALPLNSKKIDGRFTSWAIPPAKSALLQNFPNPFNPDTWIPYQLKEASDVTIRIFDASGRLVRELRLGYKPAGVYVSRDRAAYWDGKNEAGEPVASGIYFYTIQAGDFTTTRKMIIQK